MNREILFRGKREDTGEWVFGNLWGDSTIIPCEQAFEIEANRIYGCDLVAYSVDKETVGQYTGLNDKTGKRIFEGDVVLKRTYNGKRPFPVTFDSGMFHAGYGGGSSTATHGYTLDDKQIEVIGNVYDNPELLRDGGKP